MTTATTANERGRQRRAGGRQAIVEPATEACGLEPWSAAGFLAASANVEETRTPGVARAPAAAADR